MWHHMGDVAAVTVLQKRYHNYISDSNYSISKTPSEARQDSMLAFGEQTMEQTSECAWCVSLKRSRH